MMAFGNEEHAALIAAAVLLAPKVEIVLDNPGTKATAALHVAELAAAIVKEIRQQQSSAGTS